MRFLRRASSFFSNLSSSGESVRSKISMLLTAKSLVTIGVFALPFAVILLVFLTIISLFNYKINLMQMVDGIGADNNESSSTTTCSGDDCVVIGPGAKGSLTAAQRQQIVSFAYSQLGVGYNFGPGGGAGGSCDNDIPGVSLSCNGLVYHAYSKAGIEIPCYSVGQMSSAPVVTSLGKVSDMTAGDIIVYDAQGRVNRPDINYSSLRGPTYATHHVALYVGNGVMIESSFGGVAKKNVVDYEYSYSVTW